MTISFLGRATKENGALFEDLIAERAPLRRRSTSDEDGRQSTDLGMFLVLHKRKIAVRVWKYIMRLKCCCVYLPT